jgi:hypothetical protein
MASQSAQRDALRVCEWDVCDLHWAHGSTREMQRVQCVFRRVPHGASWSDWEPWVVVAESCIMRRVGKSGLGLYAARSFQRDNIVGAYEGAVVGTYPSRQAALASVQCARLVRRGHDKLITRRPRDGGRGVELVDGDQGGGPPLLHRINDPRGTRLQPNVALTKARASWRASAPASARKLSSAAECLDFMAGEVWRLTRGRRLKGGGRRLKGGGRRLITRTAAQRGRTAAQWGRTAAHHKDGGSSQGRRLNRRGRAR